MGTNQVINLVLGDDKAAKQSAFDSVIISAIPVLQGEGVPEFDIVVLNQASGQSKYNYNIGMKRLSKYILNIKKVPTSAEFNTYQAMCVGVNGEPFFVPLRDFVEAPPA